MRGMEAANSLALGGGGALLAAGGAVLGPLAWSMMGVIYIAETTYNYRELSRGNITDEEFKKRQIIGAIAKVSSIFGTSIGGACGFLIGSAILPGVGTIIGVVLGGIASSLALRAITARAAERVYQILEESKQQRLNR